MCYSQLIIKIMLYHWVKKFQFGTGIDAVSECGLSTKDFPDMKGCSNPEILVMGIQTKLS